MKLNIPGYLDYANIYKDIMKRRTSTIDIIIYYVLNINYLEFILNISNESEMCILNSNEKLVNDKYYFNHVASI